MIWTMADPKPEDEESDGAYIQWEHKSKLGHYIAWFYAMSMDEGLVEIGFAKVLDTKNYTYILGLSEEDDVVDALPVLIKYSGAGIVYTIESNEDDVAAPAVSMKLSGGNMISKLYLHGAFKASENLLYMSDEISPEIMGKEIDEAAICLANNLPEPPFTKKLKADLEAEFRRIEPKQKKLWGRKAI